MQPVDILSNDAISKNGGQDSEDCSDDFILKKMGYSPSLHRGLSSVMNFAFGFTEVAVLASVCITYGFGLSSGGPSAVIWGFIVNFIVTVVVSFSMAEICSAYPSAGSVYHWAGQLVPSQYTGICSYICGWTNFLGNAAGDASFANGWASFLSSALIASGYEGITAYDQVGTSIAILFVWSFLNFFRVDKVGWVNNLAAICHTGSIVIIIIVILAKGEHTTGAFVFTAYNNDTGVTSHSYVGALGVTAALFSFAGYEASAHMAEETSNSSTAAPRGIINTVLATGFGGLGLLLALLFTTTDIEVAINGDTGNAAANVFIMAAGTNWGIGLTWLVVINLFFAGVSSVAVTGRITYALTRDNAFPRSDVLSQVHPQLKSPINAILFVYIFDALLMLLPLIPTGGEAAFYSIVGLCTIGFQVSYGIPILLKLIFNPSNFPKTPMSLGVWSVPCGVLSCAWLFGTSCLFFLPTTAPVDAGTMNWLIVVVAGVFVCGSLNWFLNPVKFKGPKRVDVEMVGLTRPSTASVDNNQYARGRKPSDVVPDEPFNTDA